MITGSVIFSLVAGVNMDNEVQRWINAGITQTIALYSKSGLKEGELQAIREGLQQAGTLMGRIYPAMLAISQAGIVIVNMIVLGGFAARGKLDLDLGDFRCFKNDDRLVWLLIISGFSLLPDHAALNRVGLNLLLVVLFAYLFQGLAVMSHFFTRFAVPAVGRFMFYLFLLLQPYLLAGLAALGIFDIWGNFRAPKQQNL